MIPPARPLNLLATWRALLMALGFAAVVQSVACGHYALASIAFAGLLTQLALLVIPDR